MYHSNVSAFISCPRRVGGREAGEGDDDVDRGGRLGPVNGGV